MKKLLSILDFRSDGIFKIVALLIVMSSFVGGITLPPPFYYGSLAVCGLMIIKNGKLKVKNVYVLLFLIICFFSLLINNPPSYFRAWERLGGYTMILLVVSSLFACKYSTQLRAKILYYIMEVAILLSVGSFFAYFLGINLFVRLGEQLEISAGKFSGLMNHSMVLGPVAGLSGFVLFASILSKKTKKDYLFTGAMALCCFGACLLSASRAAVGATGVACVYALFRYYRKRMSKMVTVVVVMVGLLMATFPLWGGVTDFLVQKQKGNESMGSAIYSRERKFTARILEFKSSPIIGIGYNVVIPEYDGVVMSNGQIEPGSSWLAVASMTGVLGLSVFITICVKEMRRAWKIERPLTSSILGGMLLFFLVHMIAEGYIFAPKNCLSMLFWLIIAVIDDNMHLKEIEYKLV